MKCPACDGELIKQNAGDIEVDRCVSCCGVWYQQDELRRAKDQADEQLNWLDFDIWKDREKLTTLSRSRSCPSCGKPLVVLKYADTKVEIDCCPTCKGVWLDKGEFERIIAALEQEVNSKSFSEYLKASLSEAREILDGPEPIHSEWKDFMSVLKMMEYRFFAEHDNFFRELMNFQQSLPH